MTGHLFVVAGDVTKLHCDAWLLPTDDAFHVEAGWRGALDEAGGWPTELGGLLSVHA